MDAWNTWLRTCRTDSCPDAASTDSNGVFAVRNAAFRCSATAINTLTVPFTCRCKLSIEPSTSRTSRSETPDDRTPVRTASTSRTACSTARDSEVCEMTTGVVMYP